MIDKKEFLSQFDLTAEKYMYMIERKIVIDSRPPYINIQIVRASDVDDLHRLYEEIKLTHYIDEPIRDLPRFKMKGEE
jgi:hypothetical protein